MGSQIDELESLQVQVALDIQPDDEIITTAKPVFVDIDEKTYNIDPKKIEEKISSKTKAIIPVWTTM